MLQRLIQSLPLLLIFPSFVLATDQGLIAQTITDHSEENYLGSRVGLPDLVIKQMLETWVQGSYAQEEGNLALAQENFQNNRKRIEQTPFPQQKCFMSFNETLLEGAMTNQSPDFLRVESQCFDQVTRLLSVYSASQ
ncbi:hypothetical protein [Gloeothece verrucosa]|nr:hypothetical protein [Gloeothece verrucosa]